MSKLNQSEKTRIKKQPVLKAFILFMLCTSGAFAWTDHSLISYTALSVMPELKEQVQAETLESFLTKEEAQLAKVLDSEEQWALVNVPTYPGRPAAFRFETGKGGDIAVRFLRAIRANPTIGSALYVQTIPGTDLHGKQTLSWDKISILKRNHVMIPFTALQPGQNVSALEVVATACDEPDYGLDIRLFEDNDTDFGKEYAFGKQPFGNPSLEYSSQAPFHMGFYHEAWIAYAAAPFLKRTYPEFRVHLFLALSRLAFETGHKYWGYRFAGIGLHYVQDLTQPYHTMVFPGRSTFSMLLINFLDIIGFHGPKTRAIEHVSNTHILIEKYEYQLLKDLLGKKDGTHPVIRALVDSSKDGSYPAYDDSYVRNVITLEAHDRASDADVALMEAMPEKLLNGPSSELDADFDLLTMVSDSSVEKRSILDGFLVNLLGSAGSHSRNYLRAAIGQTPK